MLFERPLIARHLSRYNPRTKENDLAIIKLADPIDLESTGALLAEMCPMAPREYPFDLSTVGTHWPNEDPAKFLAAPVYELIHTFPWKTNNVLSISGATNQPASCVGMPGSPLFVVEHYLGEDLYCFYGVQKDSACDGFGSFTRAESYVPWINWAIVELLSN